MKAESSWRQWQRSMAYRMAKISIWRKRNASVERNHISKRKILYQHQRKDIAGNSKTLKAAWPAQPAISWRLSMAAESLKM